MIQTFDLFACLQPFSTCRLDLDTLTIHRHAIGDNIVDTLKRWFEEGREEDVRYLVKSLLERATTQACINKGEDEHATSLLADSFKLTELHRSCIELLRELAISDDETTKLLSTLTTAHQESGGTAHGTLTGHITPLSTLCRMAALPLDSTGFRSHMGGELTLQCRFNLLDLPKLDSQLQGRLRLFKNFRRVGSIDHQALKKSLSTKSKLLCSSFRF